MNNWITLTKEKAESHPAYGIRGSAAFLRAISVVLPGLGLLQSVGALPQIISARGSLLLMDYLLPVPAVIYLLWSGQNAILLGKHKAAFIRSFFTFLAVGPIISISALLIWSINAGASGKGEAISTDMTLHLLSNVLAWAIWAAIWVPYVIFSKRINVTLLNRIRNNDPFSKSLAEVPARNQGPSETNMGFFSKLFGLENKRSETPNETAPNALIHMHKLAYTSSMATGMLMMHDLGLPDAKTDEDKQRIHTRGSIQARLIFGKPMKPEHQQFDIDSEYKALLAWLESRPIFKELVVQTLRVENVLAFTRTGQTPDPVIGKAVLERYGRDFPTEVDPENYRKLLNTAVNAMPPYLQETILDHLMSK